MEVEIIPEAQTYNPTTGYAMGQRVQTYSNSIISGFQVKSDLENIPAL